VTDHDDYARWVEPLDWSAFWKSEDTVNDWLIEPLVPSGRHVSLYARAKVGKSLLTLDAVAAAATGQSALGFPARDKVHVCYFDLEMGPVDLRDRMTALGYGPDSDLGCLHYFQSPGLPPLDTPLGGEVVCAIAQRYGAELVVIDTLTRAVRGEENSSDTYRAFQLHTAGRLRALGIAVLSIDHAGKDARQGQRGSSAKEEGVDVIFGLAEDGDSLTLRRTANRVPWVPLSTAIRREHSPHLRHVVLPMALPDGAVETAALLDQLAVPRDAPRTTAEAALRDAGQGRRTEVVAAAVRYRKREQR
jgi:hypothetical protein